MRIPRFFRENWQTMLVVVLAAGLWACAVAIVVKRQVMTPDGKMIESGPWAAALGVSGMIAAMLTVFLVGGVIDTAIRRYMSVKNWTAMRVAMAAMLSAALALPTCVYYNFDWKGDYIALATIAWAALLAAAIAQLIILMLELFEVGDYREMRR